MSLENDERRLTDQPAETVHEVPKKVKITYTREFLLSLSELASCKKLPDGLDQSFLSEFEEAFKGQTPTSGLSANNFRRNDYSSSPPTRSDAAGCSRPLHGRWESRSSLRSDKDSDTQSDKDSDSGRHYANQSRRPWQVPEHDGLLGSGSFPRAAGFAGGLAASKIRPNDTYQLNRTSEPYQPPRPYKAAPLTRKEITDSLNDETFGSDDTTEDRAEEERKRRDSFEQMRKEQLQDMQKLKPEKNKGGFDFSSLLNDDSEAKRPSARSSETTEPRVPPASNNDGEKSTLPLQTPASRPLVPPGFASTVVERKIGTKPLNLPHQVEVGSSRNEDNILHGKGNRVVNGTSDNRVEKQPVEQIILGEQHHASASTHALFDITSEKRVNFIPPQGANNKTIGIDSRFHNKLNTTQALEASRNNDRVEINAEKGFDSTSVLEKLFSGAVPLNGLGSSNIIEPHASIIDEAVDSHTVNSSKFAQWFHEEDKKPANVISASEILCGRPNDLLSMIVGGEKSGAHITDGKLSSHGLLNFPTQNAKPAERILTSSILPPVASDSEHLYKFTKPEAASAVLTCEDLEQSILSGISGSVPALQPPLQRSIVPDRQAGPPKAKVDNHASQHLLSLLQKGISVRDIEPSLDQETASHDDGTATFQISKEKGADNGFDSGKRLTLETLFGTAFMKELQSVGAPVSTKRGLVGSARVETMETDGLPFPQSEISYVPAFDVGSNSSTHTNSDMAAHKRKQTKSDRLDEQLLGFDNPLDLLEVRSDLGSKMGFLDESVDIQPPGEGSLHAGSEPVNIQNFVSTRNLMENNVVSSPNTEVDIAEKLAALDSGFKGFKDARSLESQGSGPPFLRGPHDLSQSEIPYQNLNVQLSSQQLHHLQMNHMGTLFHPSDSHPGNANSQMNFVTPEGMIRTDPPQSHQFPANMLRSPFHHLNTAQSGFDARHHPMLQQMLMAGSFPPAHLQQRLSAAPALSPHVNRGTPMPAHPKSQVSGSMEQRNPITGYPFGPRPVNLGGHGMPSPAPDVAVGSNHPKAFQRLLDMEMRSNPKQMHPFASGSGHHVRGMYGHELDMGLGFR